MNDAILAALIRSEGVCHEARSAPRRSDFLLAEFETKGTTVSPGACLSVVPLLDLVGSRFCAQVQAGRAAKIRPPGFVTASAKVRTPRMTLPGDHPDQFDEHTLTDFMPVSASVRDL
jgi:hypothetical protein